MSSEIDLPYKLNELNILYLPIKRFSIDLDMDHLGKLSFIQSSNDLLNRVLLVSHLPDFDIDTNLVNVQFQEQLILIQSIQDIHNQAKQVKRTFRKAAIKTALESDLSDQVLASLSTLTITLCLLFQHLIVHKKDLS